MSDTKHTPGPWTIEGPSRAPRNDYAIVAGDRQIIAEAFYHTSSEVFQPSEANARLIASAPDLLAALEVAHVKRCICHRLPERNVFNGCIHDKKEPHAHPFDDPRCLSFRAAALGKVKP